MSSDAACIPIERVLRFARLQTVRKRGTRQSDSSSFEEGVERSVWDVLRSGTNPETQMAGRLFSIPPQPCTESKTELDCVSSTQGELDRNLRQYFEEETEVRFVPPREAWRPVRSKLVKVDSFVPNLEP